MSTTVSAAFRRRVLRLIAGASPDARTRFEIKHTRLEELTPLTVDGQLVAVLERLPWESRVLHRACWRLYPGVPPAGLKTLGQIPGLAKVRGLIWMRLARQYLARAAQAGFEPVAQMCNLARRLSAYSPFDTGVDVRLAKRTECEALGRLARTMFTLDRFHADPLVKTRWANEAHAQWTRNAVRRQAADATLVAEVGGRLAGFHAVSWIDTPSTRVGLTVLIGVSPRYRGRGVGRALLNSGLQHMYQGGARQAWIRTEYLNRAARRLYQIFEFTEQNRFWYVRKYQG